MGSPLEPPDSPAAVETVFSETEASRLGPSSYLVLVAAPLAIGLFLWRGWYRLPTTRPRPWAPSAGAGVATFLAMLMVGVAGAEVVRRFGLDGPAAEGAAVGLRDQARLLAGLCLGQAVVVAMLLALDRKRRGAGSRRRGRRAGRLGASLIGAGGLVLVWPVVQCTAFAAGYVARQVSGEPAEPIAHKTLNLLRESPADGWFFVMAALVILAVPVLEEIMYRGVLQQLLRQVGLGRWVAIVTTSAVFALMHYDVVPGHALAALFVLSLGFGWIYEKTGRLEAAVTMHVLFNAANVALAGIL